jgi:glycosyltransferase involved in cell wall biosynthesis
VYQSVALRTDVFEALVLANLRAVKDPFLAARAARLVRADTRIVATLAGELLEPELAAELAHEARTNPRFEHLGVLSHAAALQRLSRAGALVSSSLREGGPIAVVEAAALGVPVLATNIPGHVGLLGGDHPGLFPTGDGVALASLLERCATDAAFRQELVRAGEPLARLSRPRTERESIERLVGCG